MGDTNSDLNDDGRRVSSTDATSLSESVRVGDSVTNDDSTIDSVVSFRDDLLPLDLSLPRRFDQNFDPPSPAIRNPPISCLPQIIPNIAPPSHLISGSQMTDGERRSSQAAPERSSRHPRSNVARPSSSSSNSSSRPASRVSISDPNFAERYRAVERERYRHRLAMETPEQRRARLERARLLRRQRLEAFPEVAQGIQNERAEARAELRRQEAPEQVEARLMADRLRHRNRRDDAGRDLNSAAFNYDPEEDYAGHPLLCIGDLCKICRYCSAKCFSQEPPGLCCNGGKVSLDPIDPIPDPLYTLLFNGETDVSKNFIKNITRYNDCFKMTSFGVKGSADQGWSTFRIQGQIYHKIGSLLPLNERAQARFLQVYFIGDAESQINSRTGLFDGIYRTTIANLQSLFDSRNEMIRSFRTAFERMPNDQYAIRIRDDRVPAGEHARRFNAPRTEEVAVVIANPDEGYTRDIVIQRRDFRLWRINETHPKYDALQYPIIMWRGDDGYHINLRQIDSNTRTPTVKKVSSMSFYAYHFMIRGPDHGYIFQCRDLLNQFAVDMWAKVEAERLLFLKNNQAALRAEQYIHLRDAIANDANPENIGQQVILPSTHIGSPRHMHEYAQDAMAYCRQYGRPDLFITFTCNSQWDEIQSLLLHNQRSVHRHDVVARVFRQKLIKLMQVITKDKLFGATRCHMYCVEWQKRGLPHAHILIWLEARIRATDIDRLISAEIPDPEQDPVLFRTVTKCMVHGPCGNMNPRCVCMENGRCSCRYPRAFTDETVTDTNGYPLYRRRSPQSGGFTAQITSNRVAYDIDNQWIVPYSPILCKMFGAHINVEFCHSVKSIKYICKYINKGADMAVLGISRDDQQNLNQNDEITLFQLGRYINTNEAFWKLFSFKIHDRHPNVEHLWVHLENGQRVYFRPENAQAMARNPPQTTLTAFFSLCQTDEFARTLLYHEVPMFFTFNRARKTWNRRVIGTDVENWPGVRRGDAIGRVYTVHPRYGECFYLRLLLNVVRGPRSFEELRTFDGTICSSYREACLLHGLLEDDAHYEDALREAAATKMPKQLRIFFAIMLCFSSPSNPLRLWHLFKRDLSEDILRDRQRNNPQVDYSEAIFNEALIILEDICLRIDGKTLSQLGLPSPDRSHLDPLNSEVIHETNYDRDEMRNFVDANLPLLVEDQRNAFDTIINAIENKSGGLFFLDAPGGTGKTFLINLILAYLRRDGKIILASASSGIASTLLMGGRTAHSTFKLPFDVISNENPRCSISRGSSKARMFVQCEAVIWDECTMAHKRSLEAVNSMLQDIRQNDLLFGGVVFILSGDFRQTLPVIPRGTPADELNACLKQSPLWRHVKHLRLTTNMRVHLRNEPDAEVFSERLLSIGEGRFPNRSGTISLPNDLCTVVNTVSDLIAIIFPRLSENIGNHEWLCERAILAPTNDVVNRINLSIQEQLISHDTRTYLSIDRCVDEDDAVHYPTEFLNTQNPHNFPPHILTLRVGSPIMCLRNLSPQMMNGTRMVVKKLNPNSIHATILAGPQKGEDVFIPKVNLITTDLPFELKRTQFPVRLAFSMSINKSQGQSLGMAGILLEQPCFSHGQLYVACSRVGTASKLFVLAPEGKTKNIVYPLALR